MKNSCFPNKGSVALLLDPDKSMDNLQKTIEIAVACKTNYIMVGGSLTFNSISPLVDSIKEMCSIPVILFPGNLLQLSNKTDIILLISLLSGRNPELLFGNHVLAAPFLKEVKEKVISSGYILIGCGSKTSVEYISQTQAIPMNKSDIAVATAVAGELIGFKTIYLEAGSGADCHVPLNTIKAVKKSISIPLIVGGGIKSANEAKHIFLAGADMIVIGNGCEENPDLLTDICAVRDSLFNV